MRRAITKNSYENNQENNQPGYVGIILQNLYFSFEKKHVFKPRDYALHVNLGCRPAYCSKYNAHIILLQR